MAIVCFFYLVNVGNRCVGCTKVDTNNGVRFAHCLEKKKEGEIKKKLLDRNIIGYRVREAPRVFAVTLN